MKRRQMLGSESITVTDPFILHSFELEKKYLLSLDAERLLAGFRWVAGLPALSERYGGWESSEIQGHTMGHYLTALSQAWVVSHDSELLERIRQTVAGLALCQRSDGYLFASPEEYFDRVENRKPVWVPWYTMHKLVAGLVSVCRLALLEEAKKVLSRLCGWITERVLGWDEETLKIVLSVEYGGMNDCLYAAYELIGDERILQAAHRFDELPLFQAIAEGRDILNGLHANTTIPKILGGLKRYAVMGESEQFYLVMAERFWQMVTDHHTYLNGGNSEWEHFGLPDILDAERTACNCETCNTHNMLKLSRLLYELTGKKRYAEYDAWAYVNTILSSQNHETGMTTYFQPMETGFFKVYSRPFDQFWCCTGTGMENFSDTCSGVAYRCDNVLYINRLVSAEIRLDELSLSVHADMLHSGLVELAIDKALPTQVIALRIPHWAAGHSVDLPEGISCSEQDGYLLLGGFGAERVGVAVSFTMELRRHSLPDNEYVTAFSFGPFMLSADLGTEQMETDTTGVDVTVPTKSIPVRDYLVDPEVIPQAEPATFLVRSADGCELTFAPHFLKNQVRYGIYFPVFRAGSKELLAYLAEAERKQRVMKQYDVIPVGNNQYELAHQVRGEKTDAFTDKERRGRVVFPGGSIAYTLKVPAEDCRLHLSYEGEAAITLEGAPVKPQPVIDIPQPMRGGELRLVISNASEVAELWLYGEIFVSVAQKDE